MKCFNKIFSLVLLAVIPITLIYPQTEQYKFSHLTNEDGLPTSRTEYIMKDSHGFIWIGTKLGLCRYDGYNFKVYQYDPDDSTSLTHSNTHSNILEDKEGFIWMGNNFGLNKYDPVTESFKRYIYDPNDSSSLSSNFVRAILQDRSGIIWVGTIGEGGLNRYNPEEENFTRFQNGSDYYKNSSLSIHEDQSGILWVGTLDGLFQFNRQRETFIPVEPVSPLPENFVPCYRVIREDDAGNLWFATDKTILTYKKSISKNPVLAPFNGDEIQFGDDFFPRDILVESFEEGEILWIASVKLIKYNTLSGELLVFNHDSNNPQSFIGSTSKNIYEDETGTMWISGHLGINILDKNSYQIEKHSDFFNRYGCDATVFFEDSYGSIWVGTSSKGIMQFDSGMNQIKWYQSLYRDTHGNDHTGIIWTMYEDDEGNLWIGDNHSGLYFFDRTKDKFVHCELEGLDVSKDIIWINDIYKDSHGVIWIATQLGLYKREMKDQSLTNFLFTPLSDLHWHRPVSCIYEDNNGNLWFGGNGTGLFCQSPDLRGSKTFINYSHNPKNRNSLVSNNVWKISEDSEGNLWIATYHGLDRYNREKDDFEHIRFEANIGSNFICDFVEDNKGNFWMTTDNGLLKFKIPQEKSDNNGLYEISQFLPFSDIFPYKISLLKNGKIYVGAKYSSEYGYFSFHPDSIKNNERIPPIVITDFQINNNTAKLDTSIILKKHIILNYTENFFSFEFAALDYTNPQENKYAYYLEGFEDDWIFSGTRRAAYYTGIPSGDYTFRVKGSNNDGYWNEKGAFVQMTILPPPWKTWWAYSFYVIFLFSVLYFWRRYDLKRQKLRQELKLEHMEAEKLKELDKMKSRFFANISHEFRTPLTLILGPIEKLRSYIKDKEHKKDLDMMQRNAHRLQRLINQLLNLSRLESGKMKLQTREENIVVLVNGYTQSFESLAKQKKIDLIFSSVEENIKLYIDTDKIEKILYNLMSNAFKFTEEGGLIKVAVCNSQYVKNTKEASPEIANGQPPTDNSASRWAEIIISDTGRGISRDKLDCIFDRFYQADDSYTKYQEGTGIGLALTKELVELHHGKITAESKIGKGTTFSVFLPKGKKHLKSDEIVEKTTSKVKKEEFPEPFPELEFSENKLSLDNYQNKDAGKEDKPYILIVDDNADLRNYMKGHLDQLYNISEARDGEEGYNLATEKIPDLIISDVMMPKLDGYELCKKLKTDARTSHIPIILLTARASSESRIEGLETGADDFITKPFDPLELQTRIKNLIMQRNMLHERFMKNVRKIGIEQLLTLESPDLNSMDQNFLQKAIEYIMENISDPNINVELLGEEMALSRRQLQRKIMGITGNSPNKFIRSIRLNRAAELILNKTANVTEIAYEVGFNNLSWFAKSFKEQFGVLPSEYPSENFK